MERCWIWAVLCTTQPRWDSPHLTTQSKAQAFTSRGILFAPG